MSDNPHWGGLTPVVAIDADGRPVPLGEGWPQSLGYRKISDLRAAVGLGDIPEGAKRARITAEGPPVRFRDDGVDPTADDGEILFKITLNYEGDLTSIQFIGTYTMSDGSGGIYYGASLNVTFFGR